ncbi:MAG: DUF1501 domain-containing protein, partial [Rubripirellula sp.]
KVAFVANVGSLVAPTSYDDFRAKRQLPVGLFSHADLQRHWMTVVPQDRAHIYGWGGKMADILQSGNDPSGISMNISLSGSNKFQTGKFVAPYSIDSGSDGGATQVSGYSPDPESLTNARVKMFNKIRAGLLTQTYSNLMAKTFAQTELLSMESALEFNTTVSSQEITTPFATDSFSKRMKRVAQAIAAREALGQHRQVFFVRLGGFDNHASLLTNHAELMQTVSEGLSSFYQATVELNVQDSVTAFSASDFGRTLSSNGKGSDHAWGGNHFVMGGAVDGGQIRGDYPTSLLTPTINGDNINLGRGRLIPTTSVDQYCSEMAKWFGVSPSNFPDIFPNLSNFNSEPSLNLFT